MSSRLQQALKERPHQTHAISILLTDRLDIRSMDRSFYQYKVGLSERTYQVITALKAKAVATQQPVLDILTSSENVEQGSIQPFWITNIIFVRAQKSLIEQLSRFPEVEWLDLDGQLELESHQELACEQISDSGRAGSGLKAINAGQLWRMGYTGHGTLAMGADTGIDPNHPALAKNWRARTAPKAQTWFDPNDPSSVEPAHCGDHGTHTMGIILGLDRLAKDTLGAAFNAQWIGTNILCGNGTQANIASLQWALDPDENPMTINDQPDVINNSWLDPELEQGEDCTSVYVDVFNALEAAGIAMVFSAGNRGAAPSTITSPKNINTDLVNVMSVGALNAHHANWTIAGFSSRGPSVCGGTESLLIKPEVSAPGVEIRSCSIDGAYSVKSGSSMAAPHVCGALLLLKEAFPELTGTALKLALYYSATDLGSPGEDNDYGMGLINVWAAFNYLIGQGHQPTSPWVMHDALLVDIDVPSRNCDSRAAFDLIIENGGTQNLTSMEVHYQLL
ncbi:MAG: S8 family serine peptidase, partial [Bacteroidota bacterium]